MANEPSSVYNNLVEIQEMDSVYSFETSKPNPYKMDFGSGRVGVNNQQRTRGDYNFGWAGPLVGPIKIESTGETTEVPPSGSTQWLKVAPYRGPNLGPNEIPYVDAEGFTDNNYAILLTASWCKYCKMMYNDTIEPLRKEGYKIFVVDIDEFSDIKERIYRLDKSAGKMGRGVPYFVVREGGETTKIYHGYTSPDKIRPHLKKPNPYKELTK